MARKPPRLKSNGAKTIRWPGAYAFALDRQCERDAMAAAPDYLTLPDSEVEAWERANDERKATLIAERDGQPVRVQSYMLPDGMPSPMFAHFPSNRGIFMITPDDVVTFWPRRTVEIARPQGD
jgi:hypothetical protein